MPSCRAKRGATQTRRSLQICLYPLILLHLLLRQKKTGNLFAILCCRVTSLRRRRRHCQPLPTPPREAALIFVPSAWLTLLWPLNDDVPRRPWHHAIVDTKKYLHSPLRPPSNNRIFWQCRDCFSRSGVDKVGDSRCPADALSESRCILSWKMSRRVPSKGVDVVSHASRS
jgi:hypothetical protein